MFRKKSSFHLNETEEIHTESVMMPIMTGALNFFDKSLEETYSKIIKDNQNYYLKLFILLSFTLSNVTWILNPLSEEKLSGPTLMFNLIVDGLLVALFVLLLLSKNKFKYPSQAIFLLQITLIVVIVESSQLNYEDRDFNAIILCIGFILKGLFLFPMISRCTWKSCTFISFFISAYLCIRSYDLSLFTKLRGYPAAFIATFYIFIVLSSYFAERLDRRLFYERTKMENSLLRFEYMIKEVLPSAMMIVRNGELLFFNEQTTRLLNSEDKEGILSRIQEIKIDPKSMENKRSAYEEEKMTKQANGNLGELVRLDQNQFDPSQGFHLFTGVSCEDSQDGKDKEEKFFEIKIGNIDWEGKAAVIILLSEDPTLQRMAILKQQAYHKDRLLATVSHDLRTPLNGVIGLLDIALEASQDEDVRESLVLALRSSNLLLYMINDILDFTQIANGKLRLNPIEFSPSDIVKEVTKLLKKQAKNKGLLIEFVDLIKSDRPNYKFFNDPNRLKQVLLNLIGNALKFTTRGKIVILMELQQKVKTDPGTELLKFCVRDSGCGIKEEDIPKLFKLFGKIEDQRNSELNQTGVGLGLAISQNLVKLMNSNLPGEEITVESEYGAGSSFSFCLHSLNPSNDQKKEMLSEVSPLCSPFCKAQEADKLNKIPAFPLRKPPSAVAPRIRALLVDDDQLNILVLKKIFASFRDCTYDLAFDGKQALDLVSSRAKALIFYDIILMDCNMPEMDGFEATRNIMNLVAEKIIPNVAIVAATANVSQADYEKCFSSGMIDYLSKPFTRDMIRKVMDKHVNKNAS